ncbi:F-box protein CPR1-like [Salvia miltiorrhiza]|uniref:F-box protein CPR1-like n=1 Tax=Salvia miltiorrhiza TaxID=226208 RepID=UPI0025ACF06B|nr:F-box protein CPR1-like [Salvia miltiorrhiza]
MASPNFQPTIRRNPSRKLKIRPKFHHPQTHSQLSRDLPEVIVKVYSLRNDEWKRIKNFEGRWLMDAPGAFTNGKLYWIASQGYELDSGLDIVFLDLEKDEYEILQMPSYVKSGYYSRLGVCEPEGSLYVLCSHLTGADVWIMGGQDWTKLLTIPYIDDFLKYTYKRASYVLKDGRVLLLCGSTFVIFDARDSSFRYPKVRDAAEFIAVGAYVETLVSPSYSIKAASLF